MVRAKLVLPDFQCSQIERLGLREQALIIIDGAEVIHILGYVGMIQPKLFFTNIECPPRECLSRYKVSTIGFEACQIIESVGNLNKICIRRTDYDL